MAKSRGNRPNRITPRPLNDSENIAKVIREEIAKALALPPGTQTSAISPSYLQQLALNGGPTASGVAALTRDPNNNYPFGPGEPLYPAPIAPLLPSGRPAPQRWDYPVSWNLQTTTTRLVPWSVLRDIADQVSLVRSCIETCQSAITGLDWSFGVDTARARALAKHSDTSSHEVIADLQDKYADKIDELHRWWQMPDRVQGLNFVEWLTAVLEDELVLDAVSLYPHLTMSGQLHSMEVIDSTTIKPLLDDRGAMPQPPYAAFQQIRAGFPRGEYSQPTPIDLVDHQFISAVYGKPTGISAPTDTLIYKVRKRRSRGPYGFSCVEQALPDVELWLKRWDWLRSEYTAGVTPEMIIKATGLNISPEQRLQWEAVFNDDLSGNTADRHRAKVFPDGFEPVFPGSFDAKFSSDLDLHLIRLICACFDVLPTSLGFTPNHGMGGMGGSGHQQGEADSQLERGTKPRAKWIVSLINEISLNWLGMPSELTFQFQGLDDEDEQAEANLLNDYVKVGGMVLNEMRDRLNLPRYSIRQANEPFIATPTGPAFFNPDVQPVGMPGNLPSAQGQHPQQPGQKPELPAGSSARPADDDEEDHMPPTPAKKPSQKDPAKRAEQKAFMTFARNATRRDEWRDFSFKAHSADVGHAANKLAAAGDMDAVKCLFEFDDASGG